MANLLSKKSSTTRKQFQFPKEKWRKVSLLPLNPNSLKGRNNTIFKKFDRGSFLRMFFKQVSGGQPVQR
jgi:hypothetical protein